MSCRSSAVKNVVGKALGEMKFNAGGGAINWFPRHMTAATRAIRLRLKLSDFAIEVRDCRIPMSSVNADLRTHLSRKRRVIALNEKDLANTNVVHVEYFESHNLDCLPICAHSGQSVKKLLDLAQLKMKEAISREPALLVMVVGVPNVGKSALINSILQIASSRVTRHVSRFPGERMKRADHLPGVTQDIAGYKQPIDTMKGSIDNESKEKCEYSIKHLLPKKRPQPNTSDVLYIEDLVIAVKHTLNETLSECVGNMIEDENDLELLIYKQLNALVKAMKIPHEALEARSKVSEKFLTLFRSGKLGTFILHDVPM